LKKNSRITGITDPLLLAVDTTRAIKKGMLFKHAFLFEYLGRAYFPLFFQSWPLRLPNVGLRP
jgi:hypothetical protein